ncbi:hypothetical protein [Spirosoma pollinicola]|uniref:Uncharacterized protein n=1 Tax=Spirosoma pollinicola TaxID=2057025 RepID=A0A2K8YZN2_9BACT|nr:hypothetical protein [Spirosoma pollinicola]AUD03092.1 hypothetical protein CWM47_15365 [Spirosoma pollinicola]
MKKHTEKPPIDELFARKLGNTSLPPSADGFARLQARMGQQKPDAKIVFWRNPDAQRYMAAAACLLLVCLFGWLYWPSANSDREQGQAQVATNQAGDNSSEKVAEKQSDQRQLEGLKTKTKEDTEFSQNSAKDQVAVAEKEAQGNEGANRAVKRSTSRLKMIETVPTHVGSVVAQVKSNEGKGQNETTLPVAVAPANQPSTIQTEQLADIKPISKPAPVSERVLVVTIAEPEALVAARQVAKVAVEEKSVVAQNEKSEKEAKGGSFWQQVKRIKQGDIFARQDNATNEESGLLGRAYSGLKHNLDKDKSAKQ